MSQDNTKFEEAKELELEVQSKQIAELLNENSHSLSLRTLKKLEDGRLRAVKIHADKISGVHINSNGSLSLVSAWAVNNRIFISSFLLIIVVLSIVLFKSLSYKEPSDAFLLGAELPPEAFVDKGFEPSLNVTKNIKS